MRSTGTPAPTGEDAVLHALEAAFGPLERVGGGHHSRVYHVRGTGRAVKAYREANGMHHTEADRMRAAGLAHLVLDTLDVNGVQVLVTPYFAGHPMGAADVHRAWPNLKAAVKAVHERRAGRRVDLDVVRAKLERFRPRLPDRDLAPLFDAVRAALDAGALDVEARFCHLDLWCANILVNDDRVLIVDWTNGGWDDPARDLAILKTGTLDQLAAADARALALDAARGEGVEARLPAYVALQTLHDLYWFVTHEPSGFEEARALKVPRALELL